MNYNETFEKLERVIAKTGVKITSIEDYCGICRNTLYKYRVKELVLKDTKFSKLQEYLTMFTV